MARFIVVRLARALLTIAVVVTFAFMVLRAAGDPARALLSPETPAEAVEAFRKTWGLDAPLWCNTSNTSLRSFMVILANRCVTGVPRSLSWPSAFPSR